MQIIEKFIRRKELILSGNYKEKLEYSSVHHQRRDDISDQEEQTQQKIAAVSWL